ncbi:MAG: S53 family peptidase [Kofleriaceae bacterium]
MIATRLLFVVLVALAAGCVVDEPVEVDLDSGQLVPCTRGEFRCLVELSQGTDTDDAAALAGPRGLGVPELTEAYSIPAATGSPTIAIVTAYGYSRLEADLAAYRTNFDLPACTVANGCLRIVDQRGGSALPAESPLDNDWSIETMLDVDMASAACPRCKLLVVQAADAGLGLLEGQDTAVALGATVISNSWGRAEDGRSLAGNERYFDHPGVAIFAAAGDLGYDGGGVGASYPATSAHVIAVGGTRLERENDSARGYTESVWTKGGSGCSLTIAKPDYQPASPCGFRASADLAAVADPATGVAIYHSRAGGGWRVVGGTSAAAPLVAGIFAAAGHGHRNTKSLAVDPGSFHDITSGKNGSCGSLLCEAGSGWDGPTGFGTPNGSVLAQSVVPIVVPDPLLGPVPPTDEAAGCSTSTSASGLAVALLIAVLIPRRRRRGR